MYAHIIPLRRLPRHLGLFSYSVPKEFEKNIKLGQLVTIPFQKSEEFGLVFSIKKKDSSEDLKLLVNIVHEVPLVSEQYLELLSTTSSWYGVSIAQMAKMSVLPIQKRKIKKIELKKIKKQRPVKKKKPEYRLYSSQNEHTRLFEKLQAQTLILVPEVYLIDEVYDSLPDEKKDRVVSWHSTLSTKEKFSRWLDIRNGKKDIIIGTRSSVFLSFFNLKNIVLDYEHAENHKHWDQNPRFHAKDVAELLSWQTGATLTYASFSPSVESYFHIHKKQYSAKNYELRTKNYALIDMSEERKARNYDVFGDRVQNALLEAKEDVFIFINRKGYATSVGCNDCGFKEVCPTCTLPLIFHSETRTLHCHYCKSNKPMTTQCPACKSTIVELRGMGTEQVETILRKTIGQNSHEIIRIDSNSNHVLPDSDKPRIIIGTEMAFSQIRWNKTKLIIFIDIDKQLILPEFRAAEHVWHRIQEVMFRKNNLSTFFIQTFNPKQLTLRSLNEPDRMYRTDLNIRRSLGYPPYVYLTRYFFGHMQKDIAEIQAKRLYFLLSGELTKAKKTAILGDPIEMHPIFYRRKYWYSILIKLDQKTWQEDLVWINGFVPGSWKIDPNPISILSH
ncbi:MAG: primosomal protein N' [Candidatus Magasanikbacteria bacterium]